MPATWTQSPYRTRPTGAILSTTLMNTATRLIFQRRRRNPSSNLVLNQFVLRLAESVFRGPAATTITCIQCILGNSVRLYPDNHVSQLARREPLYAMQSAICGVDRLSPNSIPIFTVSSQGSLHTRSWERLEVPNDALLVVNQSLQ